MLSPIEKKEMLADARNIKRREIFRRAQLPSALNSLDDYLTFLSSLQKVFPDVAQAKISLRDRQYKL